MDKIDKRILDALQENGRLSNVDLAQQINLTKTPCSERVRKMENSGLISGYKAQIDPLKLGLSHVTIVHIGLEISSVKLLKEFNAAVRLVPEIETCLMIAGGFDFMLKVRTRDMAHFRDFLAEVVCSLPGVASTSSYAVMETVKDTNVIPLTGENAVKV